MNEQAIYVVKLLFVLEKIHTLFVVVVVVVIKAFSVIKQKYFLIFIHRELKNF